jgi:hypothetical protein
MKNAILSLALILSLSSFADTPQPAGVAVGGVGVAGIAIAPGARYFGTINRARYPYSHLNGYYSVTSTLLLHGETGMGTISHTSFSGVQSVFRMNCSRAFDEVGTKTCMEVSIHPLKYITTANPATKLVTLSVLDSDTGANTVLGYLRSN